MQITGRQGSMISRLRVQTEERHLGLETALAARDAQDLQIDTRALPW